MYKEKLQSQLELLEEVQKKSTNCCEVAEVMELSKQILSLAKEIDKLEETAKVTINLDIDSEELYNKVRELNNRRIKQYDNSKLP